MDYCIPSYSRHLAQPGSQAKPLTKKERKAFEAISEATKGSTNVWATAVHLVESDGRPEKIRQLFRELKSQLLDEIITMEKIIGREGIRALLTV